MTEIEWTWPAHSNSAGQAWGIVVSVVHRGQHSECAAQMHRDHLRSVSDA